MATILFTGFPGFLGSALLPRVLERSPGSRAVCLVQGKFEAMAKARVAEIEAARPALAGRIELVDGDITKPDLGLGAARKLRGETAELYHLAAVYDLSVRRKAGMAINVDGTRHVLDFAKKCGGFERLHYVSTCYVSGRYAGIFREEDLEKGQRFNNYYEETKHLAELEVRRRMEQGLPATIYRPSVVVGDSRTGATQKFDGPYFAVRWLLRQPGIAMMPVVGDPEAFRVNLVPRDFIIDAMTHLSGLAASLGKTYALADPEPLTVAELLEVVGEATKRRIVRIPMPLAAAKAALDYVPGVHWVMKMPSGVVDYFVHPTYYTTANAAADLEGSGIRVPPFRDYARILVDFVRAHPEVSSAAMT